MNSNLDNIAKDLYGKIQTRFKDIQIGDENAQTLSRKEDIPNARFFEFEYVEGGESLGTIAITLDADDGIVVQVSGDLVDDNNETTHHGAYKFIRSFRQFARDRLLKFDVDNIGKSNLDKRDYQFQAKRKEEPVMPQQPVMENKLYGSNKISYQDLGEAKLIIKHTQAVNPLLAAGRTMHIESIYIENADGERFKYPYKHLNGARALAEHIKHSGNPYDSIGKHIIGLSEELSGLRKFKGYVSRQSQISEAMGNVTNRVLERIEQIKKEIQGLQRPAYYEAFAESFEEQEAVMVPETIQNDLIDRLTIRTFNEDLKAVFPYIYKFVDESELPVVEVGADDILGEAGTIEKTATGLKHHAAKGTYGNEEDEEESDEKEERNLKSRVNRMDNIYDVKYKRSKGWQSGIEVDESFDPEVQFESFMDSIVNEDKDEIFSPNKDAKLRAIDKLNQVLSKELPGGPGGINAIESLKGLLDDEDLIDTIRDLDPDLDTRPVIQQWIQQNADKFPGNAAETLMLIHFGGIGQAEANPKSDTEELPPPPPEEPMPAPEMGAAPPAPDMGMPPPAPGAAPAPAAPPMPAPVAESIMNALRKASKAGATLETALDFGHGVKTIAEIIDECGCEAADVGFEQPQESGIPAMLKYISGFYNPAGGEQDLHEGNFTIGGTRMKIKLKKAWEDGEFGDCPASDVVKVFKLIDKKDPSQQHSGEQAHIIKLSGAPQQAKQSGFDVGGLENEMHGINPADMMKAIMQKINFGN